MRRRGFTLIELLVVVAVVAVLAALLVSAAARTLEMARAARCTANLRAAHTANLRYAIEHDTYVAAAPDMLSASNRRRWHGERDGVDQPFDGRRSPLADAFPAVGGLRQCPSFRPAAGAPNAFEASCGGYGYNLLGVGSTAYATGFSAAALAEGMGPEDIDSPSETVMFCDTAFGQPYDEPEHLIEYSFAEGYRFVDGYGREFGRATPSVHFRHNGRANVVWCDGHVSREAMTVEADAAQSELGIGWFGPANNELFDPF